VCVSDGSGLFGGWDWTSDTQRSYLLYLCMTASWHNRGPTASLSGQIRQQQLKQAIESSSWNRHNWGAVWSGHTRLVQ